MIYFQEYEHTGYALRTRVNAETASATLCFAVHWKADEIILSRKTCYGKPFIEIDLTDYRRHTEREIQEIADHLLFTASQDINVTGNTMDKLRGKYTQEGVNAAVNDLLSRVHEYTPILSVRSGGNTGPEASALYWADDNDIPATCLAPKGWMWRNENGVDILGETAFMKRFPRYDLSELF